MSENKNKLIRIRQCRVIEQPFLQYEDDELIEKFFKENMMSYFKRAIAELKPEDIINIRDDGGLRYYDIDIVIKKY